MRGNPAEELIYLVAPAGHPNFGDEFIVSAWLRELTRRRPRARVVLDCHSPGVAAVLHHRMHPNLTVTDSLWLLAERATDAAGAAASVHDPGREPRLVSGINLANSADTIQLLGGGWLNDNWPHHTRLVAAAATAGGPGVRRFATGQGLVPGEQIAGELARWWAAFELVGIRDEPSAEVLPPGTDSPLTGDDAWLSAADPHARHGLGQGPADARERDFLVAAQSDLLDLPVEQLADWLCTTLRHLGATGQRLAFVECIPRDDAAVWEHMRGIDPELCAGARFVGFDELWAQGLPARAGQTWLSTRYHPHLIAAARGAGGIAVVAHQGAYYRVKHEAVGSPWPIVQVGEAAAGQLPAPGVGHSPAEARTRHHRAVEIAERLYPARPWAPGMLRRAVARRLAGLRRG